MNRSIFALTAVLLCSVSCQFDSMRLQNPEELGTDQDLYLISKEGGSVTVKIYANTAGTVRPLGDPSWLTLSTDSFNGDATLEVTAKNNPGTRRMAQLLLDTGVRKDTVDVRQTGAIEEYLILESTAGIVYNGKGDTKIGISTNVPDSKFSYRKIYLDDQTQQWIKSVSVSADSLVLSTEDNTDEKNVRRAVLEINYVDDWGIDLGTEIQLTQANAKNKLGNEISFKELRDMATTTPTKVDDDYTITGYVVSDASSGNVAENTQTTSTTIDYTVCMRTAYVESEDGAYGVMVEFQSTADNILENNSLAKLNLEDAMLVRYDNPERYVVTNLTSSSVVSVTVVDSTLVPVNERRMSQLKDSDIYTRVRLTDCEYPVRKGSLTPVNEGYTIYSSTSRVNKFASLIRDIEGSSMYVYTNTTCPYRRDGTRMGYGRGSVTGVLVHEKYRRFIDQDAAEESECGNIGRYQLRHMSRAAFDFNDDFRDGFSEMICEWRYLTQGNADNSWSATYGTGTMNHSYVGSVQASYNTRTYPQYDFCYLGPVEKVSTSAENGFGIILEDGTDYGADYTGNMNKGVLQPNNNICLCWMSSNWWDDNRKGADYWVVHFSTKGITTDVLSLQLSAYNATQQGYSPNQWKIQWAETNTTLTVWKDIAEYSLPDVVLWAVTQPWQCPGAKPMDFLLPLEMLGKDDVYVRLIPRNRLGSTPQGYLDATYKNGTAGSTSAPNSAMNYFAIRYNK